MRTTSSHAGQAGFSLIEIIATLVILGLVAIGATLGFSEVIRGFVLQSDHSDMAQKAEVALLRMHQELMHLRTVSASTSNSITYVPAFDLTSPEPSTTLTLDGNRIRLGGDILMDGVQRFQLIYRDNANGTGGTSNSFDFQTTDVIEIRLAVEGATPGANATVREFSTRVTPTVAHFTSN